MTDFHPKLKTQNPKPKIQNPVFLDWPVFTPHNSYKGSYIVRGKK